MNSSRLFEGAFRSRGAAVFLGGFLALRFALGFTLGSDLALAEEFPDFALYFGPRASTEPYAAPAEGEFPIVSRNASPLLGFKLGVKRATKGALTTWEFSGLLGRDGGRLVLRGGDGASLAEGAAFTEARAALAAEAPDLALLSTDRITEEFLAPLELFVLPTASSDGAASCPSTPTSWRRSTTGSRAAARSSSSSTTPTSPASPPSRCSSGSGSRPEWGSRAASRRASPTAPILSAAW